MNDPQSANGRSTSAAGSPGVAPGVAARARAALWAGAVVAVVGVPQTIAYAVLAGIPPSYGLAAGAVCGLVSALIGRHPAVITGPTNTTSLLLVAALAPFAAGGFDASALQVLATLTLLAGFWRLAGAALGAADWTRFFPESVLVGFGTGAAVLIAITQLDDALGLPSLPGRTLPGALWAVAEAIAAGTRVDFAVLALTVASAVFIARRPALRGVPTSLLVVAVAPALSWLAEWAGASVPLLGHRHDIPAGWPELALPAFGPGAWDRVWEPLITPSLAVAVLGTMELAVVARTTSDSSIQRVPLGRELIAQGAANVVGAFAGGMPSSASLSRSALLHSLRPVGQWAAIVAALASGGLVFAAAPVVAYIPLWSMAAVLWATAARMIRWSRIVRMWRTSARTRLLLGLTFSLAVTLPIHYALLTGAVVGLLIHLADSSTPHMRAYVAVGGHLLPRTSATDPTAVVVIEVSGDLHYAAVPAFVNQALQMAGTGTAGVVVDLSHAHNARYAAIEALESLVAHWRAEGRPAIVSGVDEELQELFRRADGRLSWQPTRDEPGQSALEAAQRVRRPRPG